jgi:serine/threonine protein kinase
MFIEKPGSGQFGDVQKMATSMFAEDGKSLDFVAVKMLQPPKAASAASGYSGGHTVSTGCAATIAANSAADLKVRGEFLDKINVMKQFRHPNLVRLLGVLLILEFLVGGSLEDWLPVNGPKLLKPTAAKLVHLLHQASLGMLALSRALNEPLIVHRDLAARNVLIDEKLQVKVAYYGLSRDVEED